MVKELLREQQELKEQLAITKNGGKLVKPPISFQKKPVQTLNKKSSERVPRGSGMVERDQYIKGPASRDRDSENPRAFLNLPLQVKPGEGNPKQNIKQTQSRQKQLDKKRKIQQEAEQKQLEVIEAKIEQARRRLEE